MMMLLADIASGNLDAADVLFLIAAILFFVAVLAALGVIQGTNVVAACVPAGLCLVAIAWLLL